MSSKSSLLIISFLILAIAFLLSNSAATGVFYSENYHVIMFLEAHPSSLFSMLPTVALVGIVPIAASLVLHATAYLKGNYAGIANLKSILVLIIGGLSALWGYMYCRASYITYVDAISEAHKEHVVSLDGYLLQLYSAYGMVGAVWLILGIFLTAISIYSFFRRTARA